MAASSWFIDLGLKWVSSKLNGYKTIIGSIGLILIGITGLIGHYFPDTNIPAVDADTALGYIAGGLMGLGVGHKIEKNTAITIAGQEKSNELQRQIQRDNTECEG